MAKKTDQIKPNKTAKPKAADTGVTVQVVLDRSGSMGSIRGATIEGFNAYLAEQRKLPGARFGLTQFDHDGGHAKIDVVYVDTPIEQVLPLSEATYQPRGGTPLYDAIGVTIAALEARKPAGKVVFVIITDGYENQSSEWTHQSVFDKITAKRADGWEFVFIGANVDAYAVGGSLGIAALSTRQYDATPTSAAAAYASLSRSTSDYRSGALASMVIEPQVKSEDAPPKARPRK